MGLVVALWRVSAPMDLVVVLWRVFRSHGLGCCPMESFCSYGLGCCPIESFLDLIKSWELSHRLDRVVSLLVAIPLLI